MNLSRCFPLQPLIIKGHCFYFHKVCNTFTVHLLVVDDDIFNVLVGVDVKEEIVGGIFGDGGIDVAGRAGGTGFFKLKESGEIGVNSKPE